MDRATAHPGLALNSQPPLLSPAPLRASNSPLGASPLNRATSPHQGAPAGLPLAPSPSLPPIPARGPMERSHSRHSNLGAASGATNSPPVGPASSSSPGGGLSRGLTASSREGGGGAADAPPPPLPPQPQQPQHDRLGALRSSMVRGRVQGMHLRLTPLRPRLSTARAPHVCTLAVHVGSHARSPACIQMDAQVQAPPSF